MYLLTAMGVTWSCWYARNALLCVATSGDLQCKFRTSDEETTIAEKNDPAMLPHFPTKRRRRERNIATLIVAQRANFLWSLDTRQQQVQCLHVRTFISDSIISGGDCVGGRAGFVSSWCWQSTSCSRRTFACQRRKSHSGRDFSLTRASFPRLHFFS